MALFLENSDVVSLKTSAPTLDSINVSDQDSSSSRGQSCCTAPSCLASTSSWAASCPPAPPLNGFYLMVPPRSPVACVRHVHHPFRRPNATGERTIRWVCPLCCTCCHDKKEHKRVVTRHLASHRRRARTDASTRSTALSCECWASTPLVNFGELTTPPSTFTLTMSWRVRRPIRSRYHFLLSRPSPWKG